MASDDEVELNPQDSVTTRRTRTARTSSTKRGRSRKKAVSPRATRARRSTRTAQPVDSDEEDEAQEDLSQNVSDVETSDIINDQEAEADVEGEAEAEAEAKAEAEAEAEPEPEEPSTPELPEKDVECIEEGAMENGVGSVEQECVVEECPEENNAEEVTFKLVAEDSQQDKDVPELEASPPPSILVPAVLHSPIRSGLRLKWQEDDDHATAGSGDGSQSHAEESHDPPENADPALPQEEEMEVDGVAEENHKEEMSEEVDPPLTAHDEQPEKAAVASDAEASLVKKSKGAKAAPEAQDGEGFPTEPDTEMVSEDELPSDAAKEPLETEAVSDEELPETAVSTDLPETEAVSEDELPPEKTFKKKKVGNTPKVSTKAGGDTESSTTKSTKKKKGEGQKRKLADGDTYDPSSPTSENSCDETPAAKRAALAAAGGSVPAKPQSKVRKALPELEKYWKAVKEDPSDFTGWTYLLQYVDQENDIEAAREAYDAFLAHYPYCYGYWRKYADYEKRKGHQEKCEEVFERGLKAIPLSVDLWIHYLNYCKTTYPNDEDHLRTQFEKAIAACGIEFRSDRLWESYIKWESEGRRLQNVTALYDRLLAVPTQGYTNHFETFQEHVTTHPPQKVLSVDEFLTLRQEVLPLLRQQEPSSAVDAAPGDETEAPPGEEPEEALAGRKDEETSALREKIISLRRKVHKATVAAVVDRWNYEEGIKRPYFHVKPLERCQLKNWKEYLDYEIEQGDRERIVVLFERCLIACALYEEFWVKFIRYLEGLDEDMTEKIRDVYQRACLIHHTKKPNLHLLWAVFEESHKNYDKAAEILANLEKIVPNMLQVAYRRINLERRRGDMDRVCQLYEHYISTSKNKVISNNMAIKYGRFCWKVKGDVEKAIAVLNKAVDKDKDNPRLYLQLIDMGLQKTPLNESEIILTINMFLERDTDLEQKVLFAQRKVEFLEDFGSDILSVQKAHEEFQRYLKQSKDRKKKSPEAESSSNKSESSTGKKAKTTSSDSSQHSTPAPPQPPSSTQATSATSQYPPPSYQGGGYTQTAQGSYQGGQYTTTGPQQPPTPYSQPYNQQYSQSGDPNYANYQNWGYSQTGYGGYNQGWGNYNYY